MNGDGNLDLVLANWGGDPQGSAGRTLLWLGDGAGVFTDATETNMPAVDVGWSWELELADVDNDWDLDVLVSCKACTGSYLFENDGQGVFTDVSAGRMPQLANNYEFEAMDLDGDGALDLVTINDHPGSRNGVLMNDGSGTFTDETDTVWPMGANPIGDDNMVAFVDFDSDGDPDFVVGGLSGSLDRLLENEGGTLLLRGDAFTPATSPGTLGIAVSDLNGDQVWDAVLAEGEVAFPDKVFFGVDSAPDTAPPAIGPVGLLGRSAGVSAPPAGDGGPPAILVRARVHDNKSPLEDHDLREVVVRHGLLGDPPSDTPMTWMGGYLWRATVDVLPGTYVYRVCATDAAGNEACSKEASLDVGGGGTTGGGSGSSTGAGSTGAGTTTGAGDAGTSGGSASGGAMDGGGGGCGCATGRGANGGPLLGLGLLVLLGLARRRQR